MASGTVAKYDDDIDLLALLGIVHRYRLAILGITSAFAVTSVAIALLMTPVFRATTAVSEVADTSGGLSALTDRYGGLARLAGVDLGSLTNKSNTSFATLNSRMLVEEFIRRNDLIPIMFPDATGEEVPTLWEAVKYFREQVLSISKDQATGLIKVTIDWTDPAIAAEWSTGIVHLANSLIRTKAVTEAQTSLEYLQKTVSETSVVELRQVLYGMVTIELQTLMLANARPEFAFVTVDPAVIPEERYRPRRTLLAVLGTLLGGMVSMFVVIGHQLIQSQKARQRFQAHNLTAAKY